MDFLLLAVLGVAAAVLALVDLHHAGPHPGQVLAETLDDLFRFLDVVAERLQLLGGEARGFEDLLGHP